MFLSAPKADSGDRSPWGGYWFNPVPARIGSTNITPETALQLTAVYACVRVHTNAVSTLPFQMYRTKPNGGKEQIRNHWLYRLFAKRPNAYQNPMEFRSMMHGHLELRGNAFAYIVSDRNGEATDLHPIHPDRVTIELLADAANGAPNWRYRAKNRDGSETIIVRDDMFHIKGLSSDGIMGYNPVALARKMLATGAAAQDYGVRFFDNDAAPTSGHITHETHFKDKEQRKQFREDWQEQQSGANKGKMAVLEYGLKYVPPTAISNADAQFIETKKMARSEICSMWEVPPHMIGDLERSTNNNIEHQGIEYITNKLRPRLVCWEEAIKYTFLDPEDDDLHVRFPMMELLRGDMAARAVYFNSGINTGWMVRNEARIAEDMEPLPGLDEPLQALNMTTVSAAEAQIERDAAAPPPPANVVPATPPQPSGERVGAIALAAAERVARKETQTLAALNWAWSCEEAKGKHAQFVSQALGVSREAAMQYNAARGQDLIHAGTEESDVYNAALARLTKLALEGTV
jgi:HK97 family phage portal protein